MHTLYIVCVCVYAFICIRVCVRIYIISVKCWVMHYVNQSPHKSF